MNQRQSSPIVRPKRRNNLSLSPGERAGVRAGSLDTNFPLGVQGEVPEVTAPNFEEFLL